MHDDGCMLKNDWYGDDLMRLCNMNDAAIIKKRFYRMQNKFVRFHLKVSTKCDSMCFWIIFSLKETIWVFYGAGLMIRPLCLCSEEINSNFVWIFLSLEEFKGCVINI